MSRSGWGRGRSCPEGAVRSSTAHSRPMSPDRVVVGEVRIDHDHRSILDQTVLPVPSFGADRLSVAFCAVVA